MLKELYAKLSLKGKQAWKQKGVIEKRKTNRTDWSQKRVNEDESD